MTLSKIQIWLSALTVLTGVCLPLTAAATPLTIDGSVTTNTCPGGGIVRDGGRACEYGGTVPPLTPNGTCTAGKCGTGEVCTTNADCPNPAFDSVTLKNGAIIYVTNYDNVTANKGAKGNLVLRSATTITIDKTSRITVKGGGYQPDLCNDGPGPASFPLSGGRGGCSVMDSGGGGGHFGNGGRGTKDCFLYNPKTTNQSLDKTCTFPNEWEESCGTKTSATTCSATTATEPGGLTCYGTTSPATGAGDALPIVAGQSFFHNILDVEFGAAGGDKGCRDGFDNTLASGAGGGRIVLFAANPTNTGGLSIDGRIDADGKRGCASGNDSAGGGAGGTVLLIGDTVSIGQTARITARGGRGGDSQPKALRCTSDTDCTANGSGTTGQFCRTFTEPASGATFKRCDPANCIRARVSSTVDIQTPCDPGYNKVTLGNSFADVCILASRDPTTFKTCTTVTDCATGCTGASCECLNLGTVGKKCVPVNQPICDYLDFGDDEEECRNKQNAGTCDDCAGGGGGGIINVQSRTNNIDPRAIFDVRGGEGGICSICSGEAGAGAGELQIDAAYVGEICDGKDNNFNGLIDEGLGNLNCPDGSTPAACVGGVPQTCPTVAACAGPVTDTRPRFAVVVDTSGSMVLDSAGVPHFGDGSAEYPGVGGNQTRLYAAKGALTDVLAAFPDSDYALGRYYQDSGAQRSCQTANWFECAENCCSYDDPTDNVSPAYPYYYPDGQCIPSKLYTANNSLATLGTNINIGWPDKLDCINYAGSCGPPNRGAQYLVDFGQPLSSYLMWLDNKETNFKSATDCAGGDCELRATGPTPLASSLSATLDFLKPRIACDNAIPCRKYNVILLTDGAESCQGDPAAVAAQLNAGVVKTVKGMPTTVSIKTYVIGFSVLPSEQAQLNSIAASGGTGTAFFASTKSELANALATIISGSFVFEKCNDADDDCDGLIDEDFPDKGTACDDGQLGICRGTGHKVCNAAQTGTTCQIDTPGQMATQEVCNNLDDNCNGFVDEGLSCSGCVPQQETCDGADNNCDGAIDEPQNLVDINKPCGSNIGVCKPGLTACVNGVLVCNGQTGGSTEVCDGFDNDCNGQTDGMTQTCYTGPAATLGIGPCHGGTQVCTATAGSGVASWGTCQGEVTPQTEICDGIDNDCNGLIDDGVDAGGGKHTGDQCCPAGVPCNVQPSQCDYGTYQCAGKVVVCANFKGPSKELCDGIDNDCNGQVDDIPGLGATCIAPGACAGKLVCDPTLQQLVCQPIGTTAVEICNGVDDNCNGQIDEEPDVSQNDPRVGVDCDAPPAGHDKPPCQPGKTLCVNGNVVCQGAVGPLKEVCNGKDDDCDGVADPLVGACPGQNACIQAVCVEPCRTGEFPCGGGYVCKQGYCVPTSCDNVTCPTGKVCDAGACVDPPDGGVGAGGVSGASGSAGSAGDSGASGTAGGSAGSAGTSGASGSATGGSSAGGSSGNTSTGGSSSGAAGNTGAGATAGTTPPESNVNPNAVYGLATGGGGCACRVGAPPERRPLLGFLALGLVGVVIARRRAARRAA